MKPGLRGLLIVLGILLVILLVGPFLVPVPRWRGPSRRSNWPTPIAGSLR